MIMIGNSHKESNFVPWFLLIVHSREYLFNNLSKLTTESMYSKFSNPEWNVKASWW